MQISLEQRTIEAVNVTRTRQAQVLPTPYLIKSLTDQYKDPLWAVVREYIANAYDAYYSCPERAQRWPIRVHLPTRLEPWFEVRDYGVGMSEDKLWERYTVFGDSDKQGDNDRIGGFGFGCKTAFAYKEGQPWIVTSYYRGRKMSLAAFRDESGMPAFNELCNEPTQEPDGVSVRVPIIPDHFARCAELVARLVPHAPYPLQVVGVLPVEKRKILYKGTHYIAWAPQGYYRFDANVIMGGIPYPVEYSHYGVPNNLDIILPIGSAEITPSRDALIYSERTLAALEAGVEQAKLELQARLTHELAKERVEWNALKQVYEVNESLGWLSWKPATFGPDDKPLDHTYGRKITVEQLATALGVSNVEVINRQRGKRTRRYRRNDSKIQEKQNAPVTDLLLHPRDHQPNAVILRDVSNHGEVIARFWRELGDSRHVDKRYVLLKPEGQATAGWETRIKEYFPESDTLTISELQQRYNWAPRPRVKGAKAILRGQLRYFNERGTWASQEDIPAKGFWVPLDGLSPEDPIYTAEFQKNVRDSNYTGDVEVFGLTKSMRAIAKQPGWVELLPWLKKTMAADSKALSHYKKHLIENTYRHGAVRNFLVRNKGKFNDADLNLLAERLERVHNHDEGRAKLWLVQRLGITVPDDKECIDKLWQAMLKQYPLIMLVREALGNSKLDSEVLKYVNA